MTLDADWLLANTDLGDAAQCGLCVPLHGLPIALTVKADVLNVRQEPSTECKVLARVQRGAKLHGWHSQGEWLRVTQGWVHGEYVTDAR